MNPGSKILLVDDSDEFRHMVKLTLESKGYTVVEASDGDQGLEQFQASEFAAAVVDYDMPGLNGIDLSKAIKKINPKFPILMITAYSNRLSLEEIFAIGINAYLPKPLQIDKFLKVVEQL
ncbi:MAG: response regulator [bacterium]